MQSVIFKDRIDAANELVKRLKWLKEDEEVQLEDKVQKTNQRQLSWLSLAEV
jgi:hypothetical protein